MSIFSSLYVGMSGLRVNEAGIAIIGDNIANMNTIGFKASRGVFADILNTTIMGEPGLSEVGQGALTTAIQRIHKQGALLQTGIPTDMAIGGNGFFIVDGSINGTEAQFYTRNGQFRIDGDGFMSTIAGLRLQGYQRDPVTGILSTALSDLQVGNAVSQPKPTSLMGIDVNLDPNETILGPAAVLDTTDQATLVDTSSFSTTVSVYDSLGNAHDVDVYFIHQDVGQWSWHAVIDGGALQGGTAGTITEIGTGTMTFDSDGKFDTYTPAPPGPTLTVQFDGATSQDIDIDWGDAITTDTGLGTGTSSFAGASGIKMVSQDGFGVGELTFVEIDVDGNITGTFSNGDERTLGRVALATFQSPDRLNSVGGNLFLESPDSGDPAIGEPNNGGRGSIFSAALEQSNVDLSNEFTQMIISQRGFQASSRTVTTADQMLQELINLKR